MDGSSSRRGWVKSSLPAHSTETGRTTPMVSGTYSIIIGWAWNGWVSWPTVDYISWELNFKRWPDKIGTRRNIGLSRSTATLADTMPSISVDTVATLGTVSNIRVHGTSATRHSRHTTPTTITMVRPIVPVRMVVAGGSIPVHTVKWMPR